MTQNDWTDTQLLRALHLRDHDKFKCREIGDALGRTKNSVIGALSRVDKDTNLSDPDGNKNGTMKPRWWRM